MWPETGMIVAMVAGAAVGIGLVLLMRRHKLFRWWVQRLQSAVVWFVVTPVFFMTTHESSFQKFTAEALAIACFCVGSVCIYRSQLVRRGILKDPRYTVLNQLADGAAMPLCGAGILLRGHAPIGLLLWLLGAVVALVITAIEAFRERKAASL